MKYNPNYIYYEDLSDWTWRVALHHDVKDIVNMCDAHFKQEMDMIFTPDRPYYTWQVDLAITNQIHNYARELLIVARDKKSNKLLAYAWLQRGSRTPYSQDELAEARMAHVDLDLSPRTRIKLLAQMLQHWVRWCQVCEIPVLVSSTIRREQGAFLKLHEQIGFTIRGSIAYLRVAAPINDEEEM